ncbi:hypothetical protein P0Y35_05885 [Kiritimatiellaeota bacterium B1221]|nr:hypothetical protein [Kiritimatiellaeota bacterium B1221]
MTATEKSPRELAGTREGSEVETNLKPTSDFSQAESVQQKSGNGGWVAMSKRDMKIIRTEYPRHWTTLWGVWTVLLSEANRVHSHKFTMAQTHIADRTATSDRTTVRCIGELKKLGLLKTYSKRNKKTGHQEPTTFTVFPSVSVSQMKHRPAEMTDGKPSAKPNGHSMAETITRALPKGRELLVNKEESTSDFSPGADPNGPPRKSSASSGQKKNSNTPKLRGHYPGLEKWS